MLVNSCFLPNIHQFIEKSKKLQCKDWSSLAFPLHLNNVCFMGSFLDTNEPQKQMELPKLPA